uniref:Uncharacterized protein n=1 Tax=Anguilla anguilla TaxID=7936 RepID=A0A0E9T1U1_ANGAN
MYTYAITYKLIVLAYIKNHLKPCILNALILNIRPKVCVESCWNLED